MGKSEDLKKHRDRIDAIDAKILDLLSRRGKEVQAIGRIKQKQGGAFHIPEREALVLKRLRGLNAGPYDNRAVEVIFREILSASLALEAPLKVAYLGPEGTYTHLAAIRKFGIATKFEPQTTPRDVFEEVVNSRVDYGIVPIENSTEGVVSHTLDLFMEFTLTICGEIQMEINHNLLSKEEELEKIRKVYAHPQGLAQCRHWLEEHLPKAKLYPVDSNSKGAVIAAKEKGAAAIASDYAAKLYGLNILRKHIEDYPNNFTRFLVIGKRPTTPTGNDKTSVMFSTRDEPGVLFRLLRPLADHKINLTKIESRPLKKRAWEYIFFIDVDGHQKTPEIQEVLGQMEKECSFFQILGSYPQGIEK
ncbi:MAG: prephenate dehydratase [Deltaproteobacteria bacterium]|nr:prephenate dehydratase [Deltaproteobacteria bacterium]